MQTGQDRRRMLTTLSSAAAAALIGSKRGLLRRLRRKYIAQGSDWRFFNELKQELKS